MNIQYLIRDYQQGDFPQIKELWDETDMGGPERGDDAETIEYCNSVGGKFLVMVEKKKNLIIGTSWMTFDGRRIHLHHFGIKPSYQNRQLGKKLAIESLRFIKQKGKQVKLEVHKDNQRAKKLYTGLGFFAFEDYDIFMIREIDKISIPGE